MQEKTEKIEVCEREETHRDIIIEVREKLPELDKVYDLSELFKIFGDSTRMLILSALSKHELCVCDIAEIINMTVSAVSHQLRILKNARLVKSRKEGKTVYYSMLDGHVSRIVELGMEHIEE